MISTEEKERHIKERLGLTKLNNQGCLMKIVEYNGYSDIVVEFQDQYKHKTHTSFGVFKRGQLKNPYYPEVFGKGIIGEKYNNKNQLKEYNIWCNMLRRCYDEKYQMAKPTYKECSVCKEWLLFDNFYNWIHSQENFDKWLNGERWAIDEDIIIKGNKVYSSDACCLIPENINALFTKRQNDRGDYPIGVSYHKKMNKFIARVNNPFINGCERIGYYNTPEKAFYAYKKAKEEIIKQVAEIEYNKGNITKRCYEAMMNYQVEITD